MGSAAFIYSSPESYVAELVQRND